MTEESRVLEICDAFGHCGSAQIRQNWFAPKRLSVAYAPIVLRLDQIEHPHKLAIIDRIQKKVKCTS